MTHMTHTGVTTHVNIYTYTSYAIFNSKCSPLKFPALTVTCTSIFVSKQVNQVWTPKTLHRALNVDAATSSSATPSRTSSNL